MTSLTPLKRVALLLVSLMVPWLGCDSEKEREAEKTQEHWDRMAAEARARDAALKERGRAAMTQSVVGQWEASQGKPGEGFHALMTLDVRADGTAAVTNTMPDPRTPGTKIRNTAAGSWRVENEFVVVRMERFDDGRPVPPERRELRLLAHLPSDAPPEQHYLALLGPALPGGGHRQELTYRRRQTEEPKPQQGQGR